MTTLMKAYEYALSRGEPSFKAPGGGIRIIPTRHFLDRGIKPRCMSEESFRRRIAWRLARDPGLKVVLEHLEVEREARDRNGDGTKAVVAVGAATPKLHSQDPVFLVERHGVRIEVCGLGGDVVKSVKALCVLLGFLNSACVKLFLGLIRPLFHGFGSVGWLESSNEDRSPAGLQGPTGGRPQPGDRRRA
jgi:hypothetical protein